MRRVQVIPDGEFRLYGAIVGKEVELTQRNRGTFHRSGAKEKNKAKWSHSSYPGWVRLARGMGEIVLIEVHSKKQGGEWQLLHAILGFLDRHFSGKIKSVHIHYDD
jgi:hypothetical protein